MVIEKPKLIYQVKVERRRHIRRFFWATLIFLCALAASIAFNRFQELNQLDPVLLRVGQVTALGLSTLYLIRGISGLLRGIRRKDETVRIFDRGFAWTRKGETHKYSWLQLNSYREGFRRVTVGPIVLINSGSITLRMKDGEVYKFTPIHGNLEEISKHISPYIADITGTRMGQALRSGKSVKIHDNLIVAPQGLRVGKENIRWKDVDVRVKGKRLIISRRRPAGDFKVVAKYPTRKIDNLVGFLDIANSTIQNHQPERFGIQTQIGVTYIE